MKKIGFIDYYLDEFHADKYPAWIEEASNGEMKVAYAYAKVDKENGLPNAEWCEQRGIELLPSIDEVVERSDYLIVLSPDNPEFHEELSVLPLQSGKPTYIDKTFAPDRGTALKLFQLAKQHGTPMYSTSALRFASEYVNADTSDVRNIISIGPGRMENYIIHQVEPIVSMMGATPLRIMATGTEEIPSFIIDFGNGKQAELHHPGEGSPFQLVLASSAQKCQVVQPASNFFLSFIENMVKFFETGEPAVDSNETIAVITIIEYANKAVRTPYEWVELPQ